MIYVRFTWLLVLISSSKNKRAPFTEFVEHTVWTFLLHNVFFTEVMDKLREQD